MMPQTFKHIQIYSLKIAKYCAIPTKYHHEKVGVFMVVAVQIPPLFVGSIRHKKFGSTLHGC